MSPHQEFMALMQAAGWAEVFRPSTAIGRPGRHVFKRDGLTVMKRYVYLAFVRTGRLPEWCK